MATHSEVHFYSTSEQQSYMRQRREATHELINTAEFCMMQKAIEAIISKLQTHLKQHNNNHPNENPLQLTLTGNEQNTILKHYAAFFILSQPGTWARKTHALALLRRLIYVREWLVDPRDDKTLVPVLASRHDGSLVTRFQLLGVEGQDDMKAKAERKIHSLFDSFFAFVDKTIQDKVSVEEAAINWGMFLLQRLAMKSAYTYLF